jgi:hypothetical protein
MSGKLEADAVWVLGGSLSSSFSSAFIFFHLFLLLPFFSSSSSSSSNGVSRLQGEGLEAPLHLRKTKLKRWTHSLYSYIFHPIQNMRCYIFTGQLFSQKYLLG